MFTVLIDPSGYVYEAVESNRLAGVTATCFFLDTEEDMYGDTRSFAQFWDASEYRQENPLATDGDGRYAWDVPVGMWQVRYEKDGYQTAYSDWLPVPPPQLEVNVGMVSYAKPNVARASGYESGIEVVFDRYMQAGTLTAANISVSVGGNPVSGKVVLLNAEADPNDPSVQFASKLRFVPDAPFSVGGNAVLTISADVRTYADVALGALYERSVEIQPEPKEILAVDALDIEHNGTGELLVSVTPAAAAAGKKVVATSHSPAIATVTEVATLDANGRAVLLVTAQLPGTAVIALSLEGTELSKQVEVRVAMPPLPVEVAEKPTANLTSGEVPKGALLTLSTTTAGAVIYYTTDGSCPCDEGEARKTYTGPIVINEDVLIIAASYREDLGYSERLGLYFMVKQQGAKVAGRVSSNNPKNPIDIVLKQGGEVKYRTSIGGAEGAGAVEQAFEFEGVAPGSYTLVINKAVHTQFTVQNVAVGAADVDLTVDSNPEVRLMALRCGDINGDGFINAMDRAEMLLPNNYGRAAVAPADPKADLNGDGYINAIDRAEMLLPYNYGRGEVVISAGGFVCP
jgi:hypothetical protein